MAKHIKLDGGTLTEETTINTVQEDTAPVLGSDLNLNDFEIVNLSPGGDIVLNANGTGEINLIGTTTNLGDPGFESGSITVNGASFPATVKVNRFGAAVEAELVIHRHSTVDESHLVFARSNTNTSSHGDVTNNQTLGDVEFAGWNTTSYYRGAAFRARVDGTPGVGDMPSRFDIMVSDDGSAVPGMGYSLRADKTSEFFGVLDVSNVTNYETLVTGDDHIPNKKFCDDNYAPTPVEFVDLGTDLDDTLSFLHGTTLDPVSVSATSNGTTIPFSMEQTGGGDVRILFEDGVHTHDCTPADTINLTPGTDVAPQRNYVYIPVTTKALTVSTSGWPAVEYAPLADVIVQSAASAQTDGLYKFHAWSDHVESENSGGHLGHINAWIRGQPATWQTGAQSTITGGASTLDISVAAGTILQLHLHDYPAFDTATGSEIMVPNHDTTAFTRLGDLTGIDTDANGGSLTTKWYNLVAWGVVSEASGDCQLMVNIPTGSYNNNSGDQATLDLDGTAVYTIPPEYTGVGFLICRATVSELAGTYTVQQEQDLRGLFPSTSAGGAGGGSGTDAEAIHDNVAGEIGAITEKTTLVGADLVIIEDSEDTGAKKRVQVSNLPAGSELNDLTSAVTWANIPDINITESSVTQHEAALSITESQIPDLDHTDATAIHDNVAGEIGAISAKVAPVSADVIIIEDSEAAGIKKSVQIGNLPGGGGGDVVDDLTPELGGDLVTHAFEIQGGDSELTLRGGVAGGGAGQQSVLLGGHATSGIGGHAQVIAGDATTTNDGGDVSIAGGKTATGRGGRVWLLPGHPTTDGDAEDVYIQGRGGSTSASGLRFLEGASSGADYVKLAPPETIGTSRTWLLPIDDPSASDGWMMITDSTGQWSFSKEIRGEAFPPFQATRTNRSSDNIWASGLFQAERNANMLDGFGTSIAFQIKDTTASELAGQVGAIRAGADNTSDMFFMTYNGGVGTNSLYLRANGVLDVADVTNYETLVTADDHIPNRKFVIDNSGINSVVEDISPQSGGDWDTNNFAFTSSGTNDISFEQDGDQVFYLDGATKTGTFRAVNGAVINVVRNTGSNAAVGWRTLGFQANSASVMSDGFGASMQLATGTGDDASGNVMADLIGERNGADNSGGMLLRTFNLGTPTTVLELDPDGTATFHDDLNVTGDLDVGSGFITGGGTSFITFIDAGTSTFTAGGDLDIRSGVGTGDGGNINILADDNGSQTGGNITVEAGSSVSNTPGSLNLTGGNSSGAIAGGDVNITVGTSATGTDGDVNITAENVLIGTSTSKTAGNNAVTISTGSSGAGVATTGADDLVLEVPTTGGITILAPNTAGSYLAFGDPENEGVAYFGYEHANDTLVLGAGGGEVGTLDENSRLSVTSVNLAPKTVATVPAGIEGSVAYLTDGDAGSKCLAVHDGTNWKVVSLGATISAT